VEKYFEIAEYDNNRKPLKIKALDYGIRYFINPTSIYNNEKNGNSSTSSSLPVVIQGDNSQDINEISDLESQGWKRL
jgi:hypothetical protein